MRNETSPLLREYLVNPMEVLKWPNSRLRYYLVAVLPAAALHDGCNHRGKKNENKVTKHSTSVPSTVVIGEKRKRKEEEDSIEVTEQKDQQQIKNSSSDSEIHSENKVEEEGEQVCHDDKALPFVSSSFSSANVIVSDTKVGSLHIQDFLVHSSSSSVAAASLMAPDAFVCKTIHLLDLTYPFSQRSCCFTKGYGRKAEGSGSLLVTAESPIKDHQLREKEVSALIQAHHQQHRPPNPHHHRVVEENDDREEKKLATTNESKMKSQCCFLQKENPIREGDQDESKEEESPNEKNSRLKETGEEVKTESQRRISTQKGESSSACVPPTKKEGNNTAPSRSTSSVVVHSNARINSATAAVCGNGCCSLQAKLQLRFFSGVEIASLMGFPVEGNSPNVLIGANSSSLGRCQQELLRWNKCGGERFSFPPHSTEKEMRMHLGNSVHVRMVAAILFEGLMMMKAQGYIFS